MSETQITYPKRENKWNDVFFYFLFNTAAICSVILAIYNTLKSTPDYSILKDHLSWINLMPPIHLFIPFVLFAGCILSYCFILLLNRYTKLCVYTFSIVLPIIAGTIMLVASIFTIHQGIYTFVISLIFALCFFISPLIIFFSRSKLPLTIEILKHSTFTLLHNTSILFILVPIVMVLCVLILVVICHSLLVQYLSGTTQNNDYYPPTSFYPTFLFQVFMCYWMGNVVNGIFTVCSSSVIAHHYLNNNEIGGDFTESLIHSTTKSFGSIVLGSLLLSIVQFLRFLYEITNQEEDDDNKSSFTCLIHCCLDCILRLIEDILQYINRMTYVIVGMHRTSFIQSAKTACSLIKDNITMAIMEDTIMGSVIFGLTLVSGIISGCIGSLIMMIIFRSMVHSIIAFIISMIIGFLVTGFFMNAVQTSTDTIMLCYTEDMLVYNGIHCEKFGDIVNEFDQYHSFNSNNPILPEEANDLDGVYTS
ncbi:hypothetical protein EHI8A_143600 [Entamoeba histolytica HM-1:IMSS-B]|uniref:Choline transporter-like protein n=6 Tax=Entamoeba histolytica TaxID=5759 RepID=C4M8B4_ENTH1|nr:hypothetical protein, conserved [Entamoeba histolytica HM-1:IMSS]EMD47434.1 protein PNS1, putative [Entamoeba histolytica KU27]EMH75423.1 hypothetical protein EHI8A_143600 [Entamoeba histolytica HM-1:IMSS-B]EMS16231.1 protein PNS1, putative [Entamoeba histolytica HM-3:IMSS]ENY60100.1 protein PNS1, putative [Entamoeba histolytica HM-1:IMSS-A]GAT97830.1 hypothetical protein conserved [Entamoeba histolytica]|eukprot:XP_657016.1 hypothetical protein, conserved [Entamoeba histolytica HM-1:IMSS]